MFKGSTVFIYNFFEKIDNVPVNLNSDFARCLECDPEGKKTPEKNKKVDGIVKYNLSNPNNCESHLKARHIELFKKYETLKSFVKSKKEEMRSASKKTITKDEAGQQIFGKDKEGNMMMVQSKKSIDRQNTFDEAQAVAAAEGGVSFRFLGSEAFKALIAASGSNVKVKGRRTVSINVTKVYNDVVN